MRSAAAEIKATDGRFVASPIENGAHGEKLVECEFAVKNVASGEAVNGLEIERSDDLHLFDEAGQIASVLRESFDDGDAEVSAARLPVSVLQMEWSELNVGGEDVLTIWRERRIQNRGNRDIEIRRRREFAVFGGVEGAFEIINFGADVDAAREGVEKPFGGVERGESRETAESEMNLGDCAHGADIANTKCKSGIKLSGIEEFEKSALGIDAGHNGFDRDFFAVGEHEAGDGAIFRANVLNLGIGADFHASFAGSIGEGPGQRAKPSARKSGRANGMGVRGSAKQK